MNYFKVFFKAISRIKKTRKIIFGIYLDPNNLTRRDIENKIKVFDPCFYCKKIQASQTISYLIYQVKE